MDNFLAIEEILTRVGAALLCGFIVGIDREVKNKTVGLRTIMLITLSSCGLMMLVTEIVHAYISLAETNNALRVNPTNIVGSMVAGIGFLGAGAIINSKDHIIGTATAATILAAALIGLLCGFGLYVYALIFTSATFIIIGVIGYLRVKVRDDLVNDKGNVSALKDED